MKLKRRSKAVDVFSMASMTDIVFLLLIFFMVSSTFVIPSALKVLLPQSRQQAATKPLTRVTIDKDLRYYVATGTQADKEVSFADLVPFLQQAAEEEPEMFVSLYADESVPYKEVIKLLNLAVENKYKMVLATRPMK